MEVYISAHDLSTLNELIKFAQSTNYATILVVYVCAYRMPNGDKGLRYNATTLTVFNAPFLTKPYSKQTLLPTRNLKTNKKYSLEISMHS